MEIPLYLAMTAAEFACCEPLPPKIAWMACHFSPYSTGLSNCPSVLPEGSLIILNDRTPICGHDPARINEQLNRIIDKYRPCGILLDFQRPGSEETAHLTQVLTASLPCPVCVSDLYARELSSPVFLPPPKLNRTLADHLKSWTGREIWLEASRDHVCCTVTEKGCRIRQQPYMGDMPFPFSDDSLHCHYRMEKIDDTARFYLQRTADDLSALLEEAAALGVTAAVGLWQELN